MAITIPPRSSAKKISLKDKPVKSGLPENKNPVVPEGINPRWQDISARKLLAAAKSNPTDLKWLPYVSVVKVRKLVDDENRPVFRFESITTLPNTPPSRSHFCSIRPRDPKYKGALSRCPAIVLNCTCERFCFYYEYALWYRGAALMLRCNGDFPAITNPNLRLGGCKHSIRALDSLLARGL